MKQQNEDNLYNAIPEDPEDHLEKFHVLNNKKTYKWLTKDEDKKKPEKTPREIEAKISTKRLEEVTTEFANWSNALSENTANVEPASIIGLFESGHESKPALTVPIQVYELKNLPTELRMTDLDQIKEEEEEIIDIDENMNRIQQFNDSKHNYGKWYIKPKKWNHYYQNREDKDEHKHMNANEQNSVLDLQKNGEELDHEDPNLAAIEKIRLKKEQDEQNAKSKLEAEADEPPIEIELAGLHSAKAFREYLESKPTLNKPEFMKLISKIQDHDGSLHHEVAGN